jgi:hypothetical protein
MKKETAGHEMLAAGQPRPNFLVAGVPKAGTTSLYEHLRQHPQVFLPENKEPSYFVHGYGVKKWPDYLALFAGAAGHRAIGDASAIYFSYDESAAWIKSVLGELKVIVILRNPARRAFSLYVWMVREGYEDAPTFAEALRREPLRMRDPVFQERCPQFFGDYLYFTTGLYAQALRRWLDLFGRERVRVYLFEDLTRTPLDVCRDVFRFLEVDDAFMPRLDVYNEGRLPESIPWQAWLRAEPRRRRWWASRERRQRWAARLMEWNVQRGGKPAADPRILAELTERYRPDIEQVQGLIGRDLSDWLKVTI